MSMKVLSIKETAELAGVSQETVYRRVRAGALPALRHPVTQRLKVPAAIARAFATGQPIRDGD